MDRQPLRHPKKTCRQTAMKSRERKTEEEKNQHAAGKEAETPVMPGWLGRVKQRLTHRTGRETQKIAQTDRQTDR